MIETLSGGSRGAQRPLAASGANEQQRSRLSAPLERLERLVPAWVVRDVVVPFVVTRGVLMLAAMLALATQPRAPDLTGDLTSLPWLSAWTRWDAEWYLSIARDGYSFHPGAQSSVAFSPLLPLLMRFAGLLLGHGDDGLLLAGLGVANLSLLVALGYLVALARRELGAAAAGRAALYLLVFPSSLFLSAVYPQSVFLGLAIPSVYYARRGRWWTAGLLGGLCALTRPHAALLVLPLAVEYLAQHGLGFSSKRPKLPRLDRQVLALGLVPAGFLAWAGYLFWLSGNPLLVLTAGSAWDRKLEPPWQVLGSFLTTPLGTHGSAHSPLDLAFTLLLLGLVALCWARLSRTLALFATAFFLLQVSSGMLVSSMRYGLELFPVFLALAPSGRYRVFHWAYLAIAGLTGVRLMMLYALGYWVS